LQTNILIVAWGGQIAPSDHAVPERSTSAVVYLVAIARHVDWLAGGVSTVPQRYAKHNADHYGRRLLMAVKYDRCRQIPRHQLAARAARGVKGEQFDQGGRPGQPRPTSIWTLL
jgi:hypothetical protein